MNAPADLLDVGRVGRAHGIRGDVFLTLTTDRVERGAVGARLQIGGVWRTVEQSSPSGGRFRVHLSGIDTREAAEALTGQTILAEPIDDSAALWIHQLVGATVVETDGTGRGRCVAVIANPASDLLELESGALVPATFIVTSGDGVVTIDPPEGLFELFAGNDEG